LARELPQDFEYRRRGSIVLAETAEGLAGLQTKGAELSRAGVRAEVLDSAGLRALEPNLAHDLPGGVFYPDDAQLDARSATLALLDAAARCGADVRQGVDVKGLIRRRGSQITGVDTSAGLMETGAVVVAGGAWSGEMLRGEGLNLPIRPRKGHILVAAIRHASDLIRHPLAEGSYAASVKSAAADVQVALIAEKTAHDTLLLGSSREFCGFDLSVREEIIQAIATRAIRFIPSLARASAIRSYAGVRPWTPDHLPLIGPVQAFPGLFLAAGHEGAGIGLAPVTGTLIAEYLADRPISSVAQHVRPDRFAELAASTK
jgi:glycine/D-amino acid oxidase-like deaminating enzyme